VRGGAASRPVGAEMDEHQAARQRSNIILDEKKKGRKRGRERGRKRGRERGSCGGIDAH